MLDAPTPTITSKMLMQGRKSRLMLQLLFDGSVGAVLRVARDVVCACQGHRGVHGNVEFSTLLVHASFSLTKHEAEFDEILIRIQPSQTAHSGWVSEGRGPERLGGVEGVGFQENGSGAPRLTLSRARSHAFFLARAPPTCTLRVHSPFQYCHGSSVLSRAFLRLHDFIANRTP